MLITRLSYFIWVAAALLQLLPAAVCIKRKVGSRRPAFAAFIYYEAGAALFGWWLYGAGHPTAYFWAYYIAFGLSSALTLLVAMECGKFTFGPRMALPSWAPVRIATMMASAIGLVMALDLVFAATNGGRLLRAMVTTEQGLTLASLTMFLIVISYSRRLGISGQPHTHKIMAGFVLYLSVNVLAVFIRGSARPGVAVVAVALGMGAYCISLIYWTVALWTKEEDPERLTAHQTNDLTTTLKLLREKAKSLGAVTTH